MKVAFEGQERLPWKHGIVVGIPEPGAEGGNPGAARKIELSTTISKHRHAFLRGRLSQVTKHIYIDTQLGCRKHGSCAFHRLPAATAAPHLRHGIHLTYAFHTVIRQLVVPEMAYDEDDIAYILSQHPPTRRPPRGRRANTTPTSDTQPPHD